MPQSKRNLSDLSDSSPVMPNPKATRKLSLKPLEIDAVALNDDNWKRTIAMAMLNNHDHNMTIARHIENNTPSHDEVKKNTKAIESLSGVVKTLVTDNMYLNMENCKLKENQLKMETYQRRNNLLFSGIPEKHGETSADCLTKVRQAIFTVEGSSDFKISRCHRSGVYKKNQTRDIIIHLHWYPDKAKIMENKKNLPAGIFVNDDHPPEIVQRRKKLYPVYQKARNMDKYKTKVRLVTDKLVIDGRVYTVDNLEALPADLCPETLTQKSNGDTLVFFGMNSPFSNFHKSPMKIGEVQYLCAEQYIQSSKASIFKDYKALGKIMLSGDPYYMKQVGSRVNGFNINTWKNRICNIAHQAITAKFSQNNILKTKLLATGNKVIGEASRDCVWGIGKKLNRLDVLDVGQWSGDNVLGTALMKVRDELR